MRLSASSIKLVGAASMACDHIGMILLPGAVWLRYAGRLSMPLFAFMIAEGLRRTSDRGRYILRIAILGLICQAAYTAVTGDWRYLNILITYSVASALTLTAGKAMEPGAGAKSVSVFLLTAAVSAALLVFFDLSYGIWAVMIIAVSYFSQDRIVRLAAVTLILAGYSAVCAADGHWLQFASLLAVPLMALYDGEKGLKLPRYFFYVFYPAHLALLWLIRFLIVSGGK